MNPALNTATLRSLHHYTASLLIYRTVLEHPIGQAFTHLIDLLYHAAPPTQCLRGYGDWFSALAQQGQSWQTFLAHAMLADDNPFTDRAQRQAANQAANQDTDRPADLTTIPPEILAATRHDLQALQSLYHSAPERLGLWVQQICKLDNPPIAPSTTIAPCPIAFELASDWVDLLPELAAYHQQHGAGKFSTYHVFRWHQGKLLGIAQPDAIALSQLVGYETPKQKLLQNTQFLLARQPALNALLYGSRGSGKSSLVKAIANEYQTQGLRLIEVEKSQLHDLANILDQVRDQPQFFIIFVDDLSFEEDDNDFKALKVVLEGSATARAKNVVVYATSNRRHLIREFFDDRPRPRDADEIHAWDTVQEKLSFSDRFGLTLTFEASDQTTYLKIVQHLAQQAGITLDTQTLEFRALQWAKQHNGRSGRSARQFIDWITAEQAIGSY